MMGREQTNNKQTIPRLRDLMRVLAQLVIKSCVLIGGQMTQERIWQIAIHATMKREARKAVKSILRSEGKRGLWPVNMCVLAQKYVEEHYVTLRAAAELMVANGPVEWRRDYVRPRRRSRVASAAHVSTQS
jgi:hypothetical protein